MDRPRPKAGVEDRGDDPKARPHKIPNIIYKKQETPPRNEIRPPCSIYNSDMASAM